MSTTPSPPDSWIEKLLRHRTYTVAIGSVVIVGFSILSWIGIPMEVMPAENTPPFLSVSVDGKFAAGPERMELMLTLPVEGALRTVPRVQGLSSQTSGRGVSVSLTFKPRTNLNLAILQVQEALQELESQGILDMRKVAISKLNPEANAVVRLSVNKSGAIKDLNQLIREDLRLAIEGISQVSKVDISGLDPLVYEYQLDVRQMAEFGIPATRVSAALSLSPMRESLGSVQSHSSILPVAARLSIDDLEMIKKINLGERSILPVGQIGRESVIDRSKSEISHKNGKHAIFVEVFGKTGSSLFDLDRELKEVLKKFSSLSFEVILNRTDDLRAAVNDVMESLYMSIVITFVVVFIFLRKARQTTLICITIPLSVLATVLLMYMQGVSLNILTLSGLILGIGMVVDNAILVTERIEELRTKFSAKIAAAKGASEVAMPILMSTLTNAIIFLPVSFLEGGDAFTDILKSFQLPILCSLAASLVVSLVMLPLLMMWWDAAPAKQGDDQESNSPPLDVIRRGLGWIQGRQISLAIVTLIMVVGVGEAVVDINQSDIEQARDPYTTLNVKFSGDIEADRRAQIFRQLESVLLRSRGRIGYRFVVSDFNPQFTTGSFLVYPETAVDIDRVLNTQEASLRAVMQEFPRVPGVLASIGWASVAQSDVSKPDVFAISGTKTIKIESILEDLKSMILTLSGVDSAKLDREESGAKSLVFLPREGVMSQYGLKLDAVARQIAGGMASVSVNNLKLDGQAVAAKISLVSGQGAWTVEDLLKMKIAVTKTMNTSLSDLGEFVPEHFYRSISRRERIAEGKIHVRYKSGLAGEELKQTQASVRSMVSNYEFPKGYGLPKSDSEARVREMQNKSNFIIVFAVLLIYLVLASLFESYFVPLSIMLTIPLALIFAVAGLKFMGMDLDVMARLSLVILVGISVNSAIILIDLILDLKRKGLRRKQAILEGCAQRIKAVLMTAAIQVLGVIPVAMGQSKIMGIPYSSLGICIIAGMIFSTVITLVVLPMVFEFFDEVERRFKGNIG